MNMKEKKSSKWKNFWKTPIVTSLICSIIMGAICYFAVYSSLEDRVYKALDKYLADKIVYKVESVESLADSGDAVEI